MPLEIERRYLVISDSWQAQASQGERLRQAYLARTPRGAIRVRIGGDGATLTLKGRRRGIVREEFCYPIPLEDAERFLARYRTSPVIEKVRHRVRHAGMTWQVDVYAGAVTGLVMAEIELERPDQPIRLPPWVGREVTHDPRYRNSTIARSLAPPRPPRPRRPAAARVITEALPAV